MAQLVSPRESTRFSKAGLFKMLGYVPHAGQAEVHRSNAPRRVLACGVRWSKTLCAAMEAIAAALEPRKRSMGWVVAPTYDLSDKVFRELQVIALEKIAHRVVSMKRNDRSLVIRNLGGGLSEIRAKTAENEVSLLGDPNTTVLPTLRSRCGTGAVRHCPLFLVSLGWQQRGGCGAPN